MNRIKYMLLIFVLSVVAVFVPVACDSGLANAAGHPRTCGIVCNPRSGPLPTGFHWRFAPKHNGDTCVYVWAGEGEKVVRTCTDGFTKVYDN